MKSPVLLVGSGGLAREALQATYAGESFSPVGFVDDDPVTWGRDVDGLAVLGGAVLALQHDEWRLLLCPGQPAGRRRLDGFFSAAGVQDSRYATVLHPTSVVPATCTIGAGSIVLAGAVFTTAVRLGRHVVVMPGCVLTHDDVVEDLVTLCARVALGGGVRIGTGAYVGAGAVIREGVRVGEWSTVGMGAVVLDDVPAHAVYVGNPARPLRRTAVPALGGVA